MMISIVANTLNLLRSEKIVLFFEVVSNCCLSQKPKMISLDAVLTGEDVERSSEPAKC